MSIEEKTKEALITYIPTEQDWEWYYYIPLLDRQEWDGIEYDSIKYDWDELDYRFGVEYNGAIPEPSDSGLVLGILFVAFVVAYKWFKKWK
jgi:hypothetical protein